jgi:hypothetical protein
MPLNPLRDALSRSGVTAARHDSPFRAQAEAGLAGFRAARAELEAQVRRGDLTPKVARQRAAEAAEALRRDLMARREAFSPTPRLFVDRLVQVAEARRASRDAATLEGLQRETNRLLRQALVEQQIVTRAAEFEAGTFVRPVAGGAAAPTLGSLLAFHERSTQAGDEAAREWSRRQLEAMRPRVTSDEDHRRIDAACDRPDRVNPLIVARYVEALGAAGAAERERFVAEAMAAADANACCAAFAIARDAPEGTAARWVRDVLDGVAAFPDAALSTLRAWEADARGQDAEAARGIAEHAASLAESEARAFQVPAPDDAELRRQARAEARPAAAPHEPIGLNLARRGLSPDEFAALQAQPAEPADAEGA